MTYKLAWTPAAWKDLERLDEALADRVQEAVGGLSENPRSRDAKKLRNADEYRIRVGDYRAIYRIDDAKFEVEIARVLHRSDAYRRKR